MNEFIQEDEVIKGILREICFSEEMPNGVELSNLIYAMKLYAKNAYTRGVRDSMQKVDKSFNEFNLWDWSGESEVYAEIDKLKTQTLDNLNNLIK